MNLAPYIEHCCLQPHAARGDVKRTCKEALDLGLKAVCVPPYYVGLARQVLDQSPVLLSTVVGFPFGYDHTASKEASVRTSVRAGARSFNISLNLAAIKSDKKNFIADEVQRLATITRLMNVEHKFIFDLALLEKEEIEWLCTIMNNEDVDFVQLSTVFSEHRVQSEEIFMVRRLLNKEISIKADAATVNHIAALNLIKFGADRIGTTDGPLVLTN